MGGVDYPRTYQEFRSWFPDDAACVGYLADMRWPDGFSCPRCGCGTSWPTECYSNKFLSGKRGVGLIITLSGPSTGTFHVESLNAPYQIEVRTSSAATPPTDLEAWQQVGDKFASEQPGGIDAAIQNPATFVLVWLMELGSDEVCTENNPYRGRLGEISFTP